jgi:hypothetical protein
MLLSLNDPQFFQLVDKELEYMKILEPSFIPILATTSKKTGIFISHLQDFLCDIGDIYIQISPKEDGDIYLSLLNFSSRKGWDFFISPYAIKTLPVFLNKDYWEVCKDINGDYELGYTVTEEDQEYLKILKQHLLGDNHK